MTSDNNLLLIVLIGIVLFWIFNINSSKKEKSSSKEKNYNKNKNVVEKFQSKPNTVQSPILKQKNVSDAELIDQLYAEKKSSTSQKIEVPRPKYTSAVSPNPNQKLIEPPPSNTNDVIRNKNYQSMAEQLVPDSKQPMYPKDNPIQQKTYQSFDENADYMLLPKNNLPDPKFAKVISSESRKTLGSSDLLPIEENKDWFQVPNKEFNLMQAVDLELPEIKIGVDTVGQSRKNATYDIRSAPPNPKFVISPWNNSTIEPDYNTKPLC